MDTNDLVKALWDLSNIITAFVVVQGITFGYACVKPELRKFIIQKSTKSIIYKLAVVSGLFELLAIFWCTYQMSNVAKTNSEIYWQSGIGRMILIFVLTIVVIYIVSIQKEPDKK